MYYPRKVEERRAKRCPQGVGVRPATPATPKRLKDNYCLLGYEAASG